MSEFNSKALLHDAGGFTGSDEAFTPAYAILPILKFIPPNSTVWCPFDQEHSYFVQMIREAGFKVIHSHIDENKNFFTFEPKKHWDLLISNPPYKGKRLFFERALSFNKPFALLMTLASFNDKYPAWSFHEAGKTMQLLKFDKRIEFVNHDGRSGGKVTFQSGYMCADFLPSDLILEELPVQSQKQPEFSQAHNTIH